MMRRLSIRRWILMVGALPIAVNAQILGPINPSGVRPIAQNSVSNMGAWGDSLWIGPRLQLNTKNNLDFLLPIGADSVVSGRGRMFSVALAKDTIFAGIGYNLEVDNSTVPSGMGFYLSTDSGKQWKFIPFPLDPCVPIPGSNSCQDVVIPYGAGSIKALPVIVQQQSPPYDVDFKGNTLFFAAWASGIKRSRDFGKTWERIVLPPTRLSELNPSLAYNFYIDPKPPAQGATNPTDYLNFNAFSVFIDRDGHVWVGTAGGVNISDNALTANADRIRWRHITASTVKNQMTGNWVIRIKQDPRTHRVWLTNWIGGLSGEKYGLVSTGDKGLSFERHLVDEKIYDVGFDGDRIYAAGDNGLFISADGGRTWEQQTTIISANARLKPETAFYAVAKAGNRLWIGTSDGLAHTSDSGKTWNITRVYMTPGEGNPFQKEVPKVTSYAYPNPFSLRQHKQVRIRFDQTNRGGANVSIYDFAMHLVRSLEESTLEGGAYEAVWDGLDGYGRKVANGTYFYRIETGGQVSNGKILILD